MKSGTPVPGSGSGPSDRGRHSFRALLVQDEPKGIDWNERKRALIAENAKRFAGTSVIQRLPSKEQREALLTALHRRNSR